MDPTLYPAKGDSQILSWIFFVTLWSCGLGFHCLDSNGNQVDWYSVYKNPVVRKLSDWKFREGLALFYLDQQSPNWTFSDYAINGSNQAVFETLSQVYNHKNDDTMHLMYNDEPPNQLAYEVMGHTKGVVAFDKKAGSGFWLIHSVPKFPGIASYSWPHTANMYGQTFLCVSFQYEQLQSVANQLLYNQPIIYAHDISEVVLSDFPILQDVLDKKDPPGVSSILHVNSLKGQDFISFAKSRQFGRDLYDALVAPNLSQDLLVETWLRSPGTPLDSNCTAQYKVIKINNIALPADGDTFSEGNDHSKWAISYSSELEEDKVLSFHSLGYWTCIGDINRMRSQFKRGGGTMCLQNQTVWTTFRQSITDFDSCYK